MISETLAKELDIEESKVNATIELIDQKNTIPFIAKFRKDVTGILNDETLWKFNKRLKYLRNLEKKKENVIESIESQGKLTEDLKKSIGKAKTLFELEDIYRAYHSKEETRATLAKEKGLNKLANIIQFQQTKIAIEEIAEDFISKEQGINSVDEAIAGAKDIIAEIISDNPIFRTLIRKITYEEGELVVEAVDEEKNSVYEMYYEHKEKIIDTAAHRLLAINRGEKEGFLKVKIIPPKEDIVDYLNRHVLIDYSEDRSQEYNEITRPIIEEAVLDSYDRLISPSIEKEIRDDLTEKAEDSSIEIFSNNLESLLMQNPVRGKVVLGWYPSLYAGSKLAIVDEDGKVLDTSDVPPLTPKNIQEAKKSVSDIINKYKVDLIALGDVAESIELEKFIVDIINGTEVKYAIINQAGASVYSSSVLGAIEFPDFDKGHRTAISIARRLQDPLSELVKIDPKSIGVGQYQHDMDQKKLNESLINVVEKVVNNVGVDLNKASISLLVYVSGIDSAIATNIVKYREENGPFTDLKELFKVDEIDKESFKQCAGFLRVYTSKNPLDAIAIHPESYEAAKKLLEETNQSLNDIFSGKLTFSGLNLRKLSKNLAIGENTLKNIVDELKNPNNDPRDGMSQPILRSDVLTMEDLEEGMTMEGTVRNVVDFGAFIDLGVHHDGLLHISKMNEGKFVNHPSDLVSVGDLVKVKIIDVDLNKKRIQLSMTV